MNKDEVSKSLPIKFSYNYGTVYDESIYIDPCYDLGDRLLDYKLIKIQC